MKDVPRHKFLSKPTKLILFLSVFLLAIENLSSNKLRTLLTLLGIIVGVASIISVVTIIQGLNETVAATFSRNGSTVFTLSKSPSVVTSREEMIKIGKRRDVTVEDAEAVQLHCADCWRVGYWSRSSQMVKRGERSADNVMVRGVTRSIFEIEDLSIEAGRVWTESEGDSGKYVAIIGTDIVRNVFDDAPPESIIGEEIRVRGAVVRVIGIAAPLGTILGVSRDNFVMVPYQAALKILPERDSLIVDIQVRESALLDGARDQVQTIMRTRRGKLTTYVGAEKEEDEGFTVETSDVFVGLYKDATDNIYLVTICVSAISLIVGGIVVMNIMLVSVAERTKEIGLRKAVGARNRDIMLQFLIEAIAIAAAGGAIGILGGFLLANLISLAIGFPMLFNFQSALMGVALSTTVGIFSGIYPAWRAAHLHPVEAMRQE